jgi:putative endonuclease
MNSSLRKGLRYEDRARRYLEARGLQLLKSNYRCRCGEIDLIMCEGDTVCFIEVRFRGSNDYGGAAMSITAAKQRKIVKAALFFLAKNPRLMQQALRFDALLIQPSSADDGLDFNWIRNAFYAE